MNTIAQRLGRAAVAAGLTAVAIALTGLAAGNAVARRDTETARQRMAARLPDEAEAALAPARRAFPGEPEGLSLWGSILALRGDKKEAEKVLRQAAAVSPRPAAALRILGDLLADTPGRETEGLAFLKRALTLAPPPAKGASYAWLRLGETALRAGDAAEAAWALRRAEEAGDAPPNLASDLEKTYQRLGLPYAAGAIRIDPTLQPASQPASQPSSQPAASRSRS